MSDSPPFYPSSTKSQDSPPLDSQHSCEQMAESQQGSTAFSLRAALVNRRHSADGTLSSGSGLTVGRGYADPNRFHPYRRQFSEGAVTAAGPLQRCSPSFSCVQEVCSPDSCSHSSCSDAPASCDHYNGTFQVSRLMNSYSEVPAAPGEPSCYLSDSFAPSMQQGSSRLYPTDDQASSSKYSLSTQSHQENTTHSFFPKPIYSYSILIFMALKNSKTGSLPVSEIYSFMTEHFPYFKTAPDGWKNSVRHNLSLNKCFVKVENKNGNSSRKGCLWALNPAKVEKMQDEMHKWRRKDPLTVRRSMARPECLDRLLGERAEKLRSLTPYTSPALLSKVVYSSTSSPQNSAQIPPPCPSLRPPPYGHIQPQQPCYPAPAATHSSNSFALYSPCGQPAAAGSLNSPMAGKMPPVYHASAQAEYGVGPRSMQDFQLEGDATYDIDTLNPSLTDLQLQGNLWEELREDGLVSDPHVTTTTLTPTSGLHEHHLHPSCLPPPASRRKADCEDKTEDSEQMLEQRGCLNGLHPVVYSGVDSLTGYLTSCTTSISLI